MIQTLADVTILNTAPDDELAYLAEQISTHDGDAYLLVHPFYDIVHHEETLNNVHYLQTRDKFWNITQNTALPVILFEEFIPTLNPASYLNQSYGHFYVVMTDTGVPEPLYINHREKMGASESWDQIASRLHNLGLRHAILGGLHLSMRPFLLTDTDKRELDHLLSITDRHAHARHWLSPDYIPCGCVGGTARNLLARSIDISFSNFTLPFCDKASHFPIR